eukprot:scaffold4260_cov81-Skeletonema_menzelii.AAC.1
MALMDNGNGLLLGLGDEQLDQALGTNRSIQRWQPPTPSVPAGGNKSFFHLTQDAANDITRGHIKRDTFYHLINSHAPPPPSLLLLMHS